MQTKQSKSQLLRNQLRQKQIEQYKKKIRQQFTHPEPSQHSHSASISFMGNGLDKCKDYSHNDSPTNQYCVSNGDGSGYCDVGDLEAVRDCLLGVSGRILELRGWLGQQGMGGANEHSIVTSICKQVDKIINILIQQQQLYHPNTPYFHNPTLQTSIQQLTKLLAPPPTAPKAGLLKIISSYQRCIISYYYKLYIKSIYRALTEGTRSGSCDLGAVGLLREGVVGIGWVVDYVGVVLGVGGVDRYNYHANRRTHSYNSPNPFISQPTKDNRHSHVHINPNHDHQPLDFTQLEQQILQQLIASINQSILLYTEIQQNFTQRNHSKSEENQKYSYILSHQILQEIYHNIGGIMFVCNCYIQHYRRDVQGYGNQEEDGLIGSLCLESIKALIRIGGETTILYYNEHAQFHRLRNSKLNLQEYQSLLENTKQILNNTIYLLQSLTQIVCQMPQTQLKQLQNSSSNCLYGTIIGIAFKLADAILHVYSWDHYWDQVGIGMDDGLIGLLELQSEHWLRCIHNPTLVATLTAILTKRCYRQDYILQLYKESNMPIYLLTCIFTCDSSSSKSIQQQQRRMVKRQNMKVYKQREAQKKSIAKNYSQYRNLKSKQQKNEKQRSQLQYLKCIYIFLSHYNIRVDEQNNLAIRYLSQIGDGCVNMYYFNRIGGVKNGRSY